MVVIGRRVGQAGRTLHNLMVHPFGARQEWPGGASGAPRLMRGRADARVRAAVERGVGRKYPCGNVPRSHIR